MGFFSKTCGSCGYSFTNEFVEFSTEEITNAFQRAVWLRPNATIIGRYDGYGRFLNTDIGIDFDEETPGDNPFTVSNHAVLMHEFCWKRIGSPRWNEAMPASDWAADQGYFIENEQEYEDYYLGKGNKRTIVNSWNVSNQKLNLYRDKMHEEI